MQTSDADADKTDEQPALHIAVERRRPPQIRRVRAPSFTRASRVLSDATEELTADDILEVKAIRLPVPTPPPTRRSLPPSFDETPCGAAISIAPLSLDLAPPPPPPPRPSFDSMDVDERPAGIPRRPSWQRATVFVAAAAVVALALGSAVALQSSHDERRPLATTAPHTPYFIAARTAVVSVAITAPARAVVTPDDESNAGPETLRSLRPSIGSRIGILRFAAPVKGVLIDGAPRKVEHGFLALPCGTHTIKTPSRSARVVAVACAGTTWL